MQRTRQISRRLAQYIRTTPVLLFVFFACLYLFTYRGQTLSYDGISMYATTRAIATHGTLAIGHSGPSTPGRDGLLYSKYGIGQSLVELPGYFLGKLVETILRPRSLSIAELLALAVNPLLMALACALFYCMARTLGFPRRTAIIATLVLGLATSLWPYAKTDFAEPLLTASLAGAVLCALVAAKKLTTETVEMVRVAERWALLAGVGLGVAATIGTTVASNAGCSAHSGAGWVGGCVAGKFLALRLAVHHGICAWRSSFHDGDLERDLRVAVWAISRSVVL